MSDFMKKAKLMPIASITPDPQNANAGTKRGLELLENSIEQYGAGRSILLDKDGRVIAGNKTLEAWHDKGHTEVLVIPTNGDVLIAVQRTDLDLLEDVKARMLAYNDNRVAQVNLDWDLEQLAADLASGLPLETIWFEDELAKLLSAAEDFAPPADFEDVDDTLSTDYCCPKCGYEWSGAPK